MAAGCQPTFKTADIEKVRAEIAENATGQGFTVSDVSLIKKSDRELSGFAKLSKDVEGYGVVDVTWSCSATMSADEATYIWKCAP